jgi:hypothetical protein
MKQVTSTHRAFYSHVPLSITRLRRTLAKDRRNWRPSPTRASWRSRMARLTKTLSTYPRTDTAGRVIRSSRTSVSRQRFTAPHGIDLNCIIQPTALRTSPKETFRGVRFSHTSAYDPMAATVGTVQLGPRYAAPARSPMPSSANDARGTRTVPRRHGLHESAPHEVGGLRGVRASLGSKASMRSRYFEFCHVPLEKSLHVVDGIESELMNSREFRQHLAELLARQRRAAYDGAAESNKHPKSLPRLFRRRRKLQQPRSRRPRRPPNRRRAERRRSVYPPRHASLS